MPPKKRNLAEAQTSQSESRRRSTRLGSTGKKSAYFENQDDVDDSDEDGPPRKTIKSNTSSSRGRSKPQTNLSDDEDQYEDSSISDDENEENEEEEEEEEEEEDEEDGLTTPPPPKSSTVKRGRGRPPKDSRAQPKAGNAQTKKPPPSIKRGGNAARDDDDKEEEEEEEDEDDDRKPRVTFIPHPKLRDTNGIEYEDTRVHPNTLHFLGDLKANNNRSWLKSHDPEYRRSLKDWESFVETLTDKIIDADDTIPELPIKDVVFRIYRDIRFSKDPTPYKPHYAAAWSRTGRKGPYACYYVQIEPGRCQVGGGLWQPEASALARLRASVDERPHRIRRVLTDPEFVRVFLPQVVGKKEDKILKAFADKNKENALKTKPKGFDPDHRDIHLLKLRNYTIGCQIPDEDIHSDDAQEKIMRLIRAMVPFVTFLNSVVMPDPGVDSDSEGEENGTDEGDREEEVEEEDGGDDK